MANLAGVLQSRFFPAKLEAEGEDAIFNTLLKRTGEPRSNVMLVDGHMRDLGMAASLRRLTAIVDGLAWTKTVWPSIVQRCGGLG